MPDHDARVTLTSLLMDVQEHGMSANEAAAHLIGAGVRLPGRGTETADEPGATAVADEPGVWIVADTFWGHEGPGETVAFGNEIDALRAVNTAGWHQRAYFVPYGKSLQEVMNRA